MLQQSNRAASCRAGKRKIIVVCHIIQQVAEVRVEKWVARGENRFGQGVVERTSCGKRDVGSLRSKESEKRPAETRQTSGEEEERRIEKWVDSLSISFR